MPNFENLKIVNGQTSKDKWNDLVDELKALDEYVHRVHINENGHLGIGQEIPTAPLSLSNPTKAQIEFKRENASGAIEQNQNGGALRLQDTDNKTKIQLRTYDNSYFNGGKVGIGNETPVGKLDISGGGLIISHPTTGDSSIQLFTNRPDITKGAYSATAGSGNEAWTIIGRSKSSQYPPKGGLIFSYWNNSRWDNRLVILNNNGNVGVGTNNPQKKLDVKGDIRASSKLEVQGGEIIIGAWRIRENGNELRFDKKVDGTYKNYLRIDQSGNFWIENPSGSGGDLIAKGDVQYYGILNHR